MDVIYQQLLLDHYRYPRNYGELPKPDFVGKHINPSCGDVVAFQGVFDQGCIATVMFTGKGCVISMATASLLTQIAQKKTGKELLALSKDDVMHLIKISLGPIRLRCALLPLQALQQGVADYLKNEGVHA